jgi:ketosteroid isomerase-like protein
MADVKHLADEQIKAKYEKYIDRFNAKDFEGLKEYLVEDLYFYRGHVPPLIGRAAMFEFYTKAWSC